MLEEAMLEEAMLEEAGRAEEAIAFYQQAAEAGDTSALSAAARMLEEAGGRPVTLAE